MPYRRSRLQDYYEELLGPDPSDEGSPAEPEPEESESWLPSYIPPIEPPTASPGLTSGESEGDGRPAPPLDVDPAVQDYERNLYQRLGIAPPNELGESTGGQSNGLSDADESQTEDTPDTNQAKDEISVQAIPPDIAEVQDDFGASRLVDENSWDRLHRYSNLDLILVRQDIETRPLIFQHCFQHSASRQEAMECIYAFPPISDENELRHVEQTAVDGSDRLTGMADGGIGDANTIGFTNSRSILRYEEHLEDKYGFLVEWSEASNETNMAGQLNNLATSVAHIVNYLTEQVYGGDESKALKAFREHFAQNEHGRLEVHLGANIRVGGAGKGRVPLPASSDDDLDKMFLGSAVKIATIVHEFGHVIDRAIGIASRFPSHHDAWYLETGVGLNESIYELAIEGFAGKQFVNEEIWPDFFMTAVLDPSNPGIRKTYTVWSTTFDRYEEYIEELVNKLIDQGYVRQAAEVQVAGSFYRCEDHGDCGGRPVKWQDNRFGQAAREHFPQLFSQFLADKWGEENGE